MSGVTGLEDISIASQDVADEKSGLVIAAKTIKFQHQFSAAGAQGLNLQSLTMPAEMAAQGETNPSPAEIAAANLILAKNNIRLISSRGFELIKGAHFRVDTSSQITFINNYQSEVGEIITGFISPVLAGSTLVTDARQYKKTQPLAIGSQIINVGFTYKVNQHSAEQIGAAEFYLDGILLARNVGNAAASPSADGNYEEYDPDGDGWSTQIRLNTPTTGSVKAFTAKTDMQLGSSDVQVWGQLEQLAGSVKKIADLFESLGVDPSTILAASPAEIDRRTFGDAVITALSRITTLEAKHPTRWQQKFLSTNVSLNTTLGDLTFNNLTIGKTYRVYLYAVIGDSATGPASQINVDIYNGATFIQGSNHTSDDATGPSNGGYGVVSRPFVATATTVTFVTTGMSGTDVVTGTGSANGTCATLEELPDHVQTTAWT